MILDHHGAPIPARLLPLHPTPWLLHEAAAAEWLKARGKIVAGSGKVNLLSALYHGYQWRSPEEKALIDARGRAITDPLERLRSENERLRQIIITLRMEAAAK
ncbi:hypothetical protein Ccr5_gp179c [Caulobacter phage Ccr5]|nr:hypothetical protein Ccr5_gp179c [Caulobacter phage Ccr5]